MGAGRPEPGPGHSFKNAWEGVTRTLTAIDFAAAFRSWLERYKQCTRLSSKFVKKSQEINILLALIVVKLSKDSHLFVFTPRMDRSRSI
jgi:hypothetical protein